MADTNPELRALREHYKASLHPTPRPSNGGLTFLFIAAGICLILFGLGGCMSMMARAGAEIHAKERAAGRP